MSVVLRVERMGPIAAADDVDLPPTTRMMTWPAVSVKHDHSGDVRGASPGLANSPTRDVKA